MANSCRGFASRRGRAVAIRRVETAVTPYAAASGGVFRMAAVNKRCPAGGVAACQTMLAAAAVSIAGPLELIDHVADETVDIVRGANHQDVLVPPVINGTRTAIDVQVSGAMVVWIRSTRF